MSDSVPDLLVEKLALGELSEAEASRVRARLGDDAEARLEAIEANNAEVLEAVPPSELARDVARRLDRLAAQDDAERRPSWTPWLATAALAAAAVLLWSFLRPPASTDTDGIAAADTGEAPEAPTKIAKVDRPESDAGGDGIRFKGGTKLKVFRQGGTEPERLSTNTAVAQGDRLQVEYAAGDAKLGVIVSIDGAGQATLHFPDTEDGNPSLRGQARLSHGYELDDAPGFERFIFVTTREDSLSVPEVMEAARTLAASPDARDGELALPAGTSQQSLLLTK